MVSSFSLLDTTIQKMLQKQGIITPTEPQQQAIPVILKKNHTLLVAPTGLGKTETALLPVFHHFLHNRVEKKGIAIVYVTPLRALNRDMLKRTIEWSKALGISIAVRHGDTPQSERTRQSRNPPDMLITTPETLQILFTGTRLRKNLATVQSVIIDEVHELASDERGVQLSVGLERLEELVDAPFQRIGLSATVGNPEETALFLGGFHRGNPRPVQILTVDVTKHLDISVELPETQKKDYAMAKKFSMDPHSFATLRRSKELIDDHVSTLLFINTRDGAEILATRMHLWQEHSAIDVHHGSLSKEARIEAENAFKSGELRGLICTSSLELGIDVGDTDFVIQYNSPREVTRLVQRIGRAGHQVGKTSTGLIISTNPEDLGESVIITKKALNGELEHHGIRPNPLSVLANQMIAIALEYKTISKDQMYTIITRSYPFHTLTREQFSMMVNQLKSQRSIWVDDHEQTISNRLRSRQYFLDNISMIPDETTYDVVDISSRSKIGRLDESFVLNYGFEGAKFILKGRPWVIVKREEDESILVAQAKDIGTVPSWVGEDIPIPFSVACEVGQLRRQAVCGVSLNNLPWKSASQKKFQQYINNQQQEGLIVPDDKSITIETDQKTLIINACFGTKVNETLGRLISAMLAQSMGESIGVNNDAYRISLELPRGVPPKKIKEILLQTKPESLGYVMETIIRNSTYIKWELIHVARKFGALRKDFDVRKVGLKKLFALFEHSPILDEAIDKLMWERMDISNTQQVLSLIQQEKICIEIQRISPIALTGFETIRGLMVPQRADRTILMALKKRLEETDITLVCTNCHHQWNTSVGRAGNQPRCSQCGAIKIIVLRRYNKDLSKLLTKKTLSKEEKKEYARLHKNASLVLGYGYYALTALMARGIGPDTAARILRKHNRLDLSQSDEIQLKFLREILEAELHYARTRGFWDAN